MKVLLERVRSHECPFLTVRRDRAMCEEAERRCLAFAQGERHVFDRRQFLDHAIPHNFVGFPSIHASIVLKSRLDLHRKDRIFSAVLTRFAFVPSIVIVPSDRHLKHITHHRQHSSFLQVQMNYISLLIRGHKNGTCRQKALGFEPQG